MPENIKTQLAQAVYELVKEDLDKSRVRTEVTRISELVTQVKVYPEDNTGPRYFTIRVSENI